MEKQKVYISGPISDRLDTYQATFREAAELVERAGFIPINPATLPLGLEKRDYMKITLAMLDSADMVLLLDDWTQSSGAQLEDGYAEYTGLPTMELRYFKERYIDPKAPAPEKESEKRPMSRVERLFGSKEEWNKEPRPQEPKEEHPDGYKGFLLTKCPKCGEVRGFCSKAYITETTCRSCGEIFPLENLIPAHVNCEKCGSHFKYRTNIETGDPVPFTCLRCEAPIDLQMNGKGTAVTTIGWKTRGGQR